MMEEMAIDYFRSLGKADKKRLIKKVFDCLEDDEKVEIAKMLIGKK